MAIRAAWRPSMSFALLFERRLPFMREPLCLCNLIGRHLLRDPVSSSYRVGSRSMGSDQAEPHVGEQVILRHAGAEFVHLSDVELRVDIVLVGGFAKPLCSFGVIALH